MSVSGNHYSSHASLAARARRPGRRAALRSGSLFGAARRAVLAARWFSAWRGVARAPEPSDGPGAVSGGASAADGATGRSAPASPPPSVRVGEPPRILIVDDEVGVRRVCAFALRGAGWRAEAEASPVAALERVLAGERFDALVLDYAMPELDGLEFLARLEALPAGARPPILLASAHADGSTARAALRLGVWDFLSKPLTPEELRRRVRRLLRRGDEAARGDSRARALDLAGAGRWADARAALGGRGGEADELVRGLLFQIEGDDVAAARCFARCHWWPDWHRHGPEIWAELARRLDVPE